MIERLFNQALAGLNYALTVAVSIIVIVIAVVAFRSLVTPEAPSTTSTTQTTTPGPVAAAPTTEPPVSTTSAPLPNCVRTAPAPSDGETRAVRLYFACGQGEDAFVAWVYRDLGPDGGLLTRTAEELVAGPTAQERKDGFRSPFSTATADAVIAVTRDDGDVVVNLRDFGPAPELDSTREGALLLASLNNTMFQHQVTESIEYRIEGSCERFWAYFAVGECRVVGRDAWETNEAAGLPG